MSKSQYPINTQIPITKESEGILKLSHWNFIWHLDLGIGHFFVCSPVLRYELIRLIFENKKRGKDGS